MKTCKGCNEEEYTKQPWHWHDCGKACGGCAHCTKGEPIGCMHGRPSAYGCPHCLGVGAASEPTETYVEKSESVHCLCGKPVCDGLKERIDKEFEADMVKTHVQPNQDLKREDWVKLLLKEFHDEEVKAKANAVQECYLQCLAVECGEGECAEAIRTKFPEFIKESTI